MMPRFRVWDKYKGIMYAVEGIDFIEQAISVRDEDVPKYFKTLYLDDSVVLMQSTGLIDKNGVEIFEGDIVKVTDEYGDSKFSDGGIGTICGLTDLYMWYIDGQVQNGLYDIKQCYYIEVIGNIYENKEALEMIK